MRGSMLKEILQEQGISISELARRLNVLQHGKAR